MFTFKRMALAAMFFGATATAQACEEYKAISADDLKSYKAKLEDPSADPIDQMFAVKEMMCSDSATMRNYAVKKGLETSSDELVRQEIMFDRMMGMNVLKIEIQSNGVNNSEDKKFVVENGGVLMINLRGRNRKMACINFVNRDDCYVDSHIKIEGPSLIINHLDNYAAIGNFDLSEYGELVGYIKFTNRGHEKIPAVIKLFN